MSTRESSSNVRGGSPGSWAWGSSFGSSCTSRSSDSVRRNCPFRCCRIGSLANPRGSSNEGRLCWLLAGIECAASRATIPRGPQALAAATASRSSAILIMLAVQILLPPTLLELELGIPSCLSSTHSLSLVCFAVSGALEDEILAVNGLEAEENPAVVDEWSFWVELPGRYVPPLNVSSVGCTRTCCRCQASRALVISWMDASPLTNRGECSGTILPGPTD